jgi:hypothetical protein
MRDAADTVTAEIPGVKPLVTRKPRPKKYASAAEKQAAYRARQNIVALTIQLPAAVAAEFKTWLEAKGKKPSPVVTKLIQTQLLRKR